jgi:hypothetical protein
VTRSKPPSGGEFAPTTALSEGTTIGPGKSLTEVVKFAPTVVGAASAEWQLNGNDASGVHKVTFTGIGGIASPPNERTGLGSLAPPDTSTTEPGRQSAAHPKAQLVSKTLTASSTGAVAVKLSCKSTQTACAGTLTLQSATASSSGGHASKQRKPVYATLAKGSYKIAPGHTATLKLKLTAAARRLLTRLRVLRVRAVTVVDGSAGAQPIRTVVLVTLHASRSRARA